MAQAWNPRATTFDGQASPKPNLMIKSLEEPGITTFSRVAIPTHQLGRINIFHRSAEKRPGYVALLKEIGQATRQSVNEQALVTCHENLNSQIEIIIAHDMMYGRRRNRGNVYSAPNAARENSSMHLAYIRIINTVNGNVEPVLFYFNNDTQNGVEDLVEGHKGHLHRTHEKKDMLNLIGSVWDHSERCFNFAHEQEWVVPRWCR